MFSFICVFMFSWSFRIFIQECCVCLVSLKCQEVAEGFIITNFVNYEGVQSRRSQSFCTRILICDVHMAKRMNSVSF